MYQADVNQNLIEILESINPSVFSKFIDSINSQPPTPEFAAFCGILCYAAFYPFFIALFGVFLWLGLKLFRESVTLDQTAVAVLISTSAVNLCSSLILLTAPFKIYFLLGLLSIIPSIIISCRATAAVLKVSPMKVFGVWFICGFICCCCSCALVALFGAVAGAAL